MDVSILNLNELLNYAILYASTPLEKALVAALDEHEGEVEYERQCAADMEEERNMHFRDYTGACEELRKAKEQIEELNFKIIQLRADLT